MKHLEKGYKEVPVLHDVSFTVRRGTVFALLGANGSGKTTTINILTTLIKADGATATVAGFDVATQPERVRDLISLTGQSAAVDYMLTGRENLVLMGELRPCVPNWSPLPCSTNSTSTTRRTVVCSPSRVGWGVGSTSP